jgi:hypothetical protein
VSSKRPDQTADDEQGDAQISQGPSSLTPTEVTGGADAVPETPDNVPADRLAEGDRGSASTTQ